MRNEFIQRARATMSPIRSLDFQQDVADLEPLDAIVGTARVVGIGESWHSARQFLAFRNRMVRYLIERRGFDVLIFEGSVSGAAVLDEFVKGKEGDPALVLRYLEQAMWLNRETADFLLWLRAHNSTRPFDERVSVCGMDSVPPTGALAGVPAYLSRIDPDLQLSIRRSWDISRSCLVPLRFPALVVRQFGALRRFLNALILRSESRFAQTSRQS